MKRAIRYSSILLIFTLVFATSCDFSETDDKAATYFNVTFLQPGTQNIIQTIGLHYNISNFEYTRIAENPDLITLTNLEYWQTKMHHDDTPLVDCLFLTPINRYLSKEELELEPIPANTTVLRVFISNFGGKTGIYKISKFIDPNTPVDGNFITFEFSTNQIRPDIAYDYTYFESRYTQVEGDIVITEYGNIGGLVKGYIILKDVPVLFHKLGNDPDDPVAREEYDIAIDFSLTRGPDLPMNFTSVYWIYNDDDYEDDEWMVLVGEPYGNLIFPVHKDGFLGWSLTNNDKEGILGEDFQIVVPEGGLTFYGIWDD